jgi:hypothetical protein
MRNSTFVKLKIQPKCFKKPPSVLALFKEGWEGAVRES